VIPNAFGIILAGIFLEVATDANFEKQGFKGHSLSNANLTVLGKLGNRIRSLFACAAVRPNDLIIGVENGN
jgi:hypothetical protein